MTLPEVFNAATYFVDRHLDEGGGGDIAIECGDEQVTYQQVAERANRLGNALRGLGIQPEQRLSVAAPKSGRHIVGVEFVKETLNKDLEAVGQMSLYLNDKQVAQGQFRTQSGHFALCGEGLCIGRDGGDVVSSEYGPGFDFSGGQVVKVVFDVAPDTYVNAERKLEAALARD